MEQAQRKAALASVVATIHTLQDAAAVFADSAGPMTACNAAAAMNAAGANANAQAARRKAIDALAQSVHSLARTLCGVSGLPACVRGVLSAVVDR